MDEDDDSAISKQHANPPLHEALDNVLQQLESSVNEIEERKLPKRSRGLDEDELWNTVGRKGKKFARAVSTDEVTRIPEEYVEVFLTCSEKLPKQFMLAKKLKEGRIGNIVRIKYINAFKVAIRFDNEESAEKILCAKSFNENGCKCVKSLDVDQSYGVIKGVDLGLTEEEIHESIKSDITIINIKRLKRKNSLDGRWEQSESIRVCFRGKSLPTHVNIFDIKINVSPFVHPVTQCSKCWRYGHTYRLCASNKPVCPKCGSSHTNCETTRFTYNNCGGNHMALAKICPLFKKETLVREIMAEYNCSYKYALILYKPDLPTPSSSISAPPSPDCFPPLVSGNNNSENLSQPFLVDNLQVRPKESYAKKVSKKVENSSGPGKKFLDKPRKIHSEEFTGNTSRTQTNDHEQSKDNVHFYPV